MTKEQIKKLLIAYNIRPTKGKGQNFLIDESILDVMLDAAQVAETDSVLEIGPGLGVLTNKLVRRARRIVAVELDTRVAMFIRSEFEGKNNFELIESDILRVKNAELAEHLGTTRYKVVANIPYAITAPLIEKFLTYEPRPTMLVLMVQKEVAERVTARPGEMSVLAVSVQYYARAEIIARVPGSSFYPEPAVDSAVLRIIPKHQHTSDEEKIFFRIVKIGFSSRRKQLHNNLSAGLRISSEEAKGYLQALDLRIDARAQDLSVEDWKKLAHITQKK